MLLFSRLVCGMMLLALNACQVYRSNFDCPPGKGVPCTPVTEIEKMIVETPDGSADIFLGYLPSETPDCKKMCDQSIPLQKMKVWIEPKEQPCGLYVDGHYIYLNKKETIHD